jgi:hypothetical protein
LLKHFVAQGVEEILPEAARRVGRPERAVLGDKAGLVELQNELPERLPAVIKAKRREAERVKIAEKVMWKMLICRYLSCVVLSGSARAGVLRICHK